MLPRVISTNIETIRVLHVDDDPHQYEFIKFFLNQVDPVLKVNCVGTPEEVMKELETNNYDCLVTDFQMPLMNGIELSRKVRQQYALPIILYTGQGSEEVAEAAFTVGVDDYLRKEMDPSHYQVLAKRIRQAVEKKQTETLYENVVEQARDAMCIIINKRIVFANKSALELFKTSNLDEIIRFNPLSGFMENDNNILTPGFHNIVLKHKGHEKYLEISTSTINYNGKDARLCFLWDTTEKRKLELEKKISQERFKALVEMSEDGIATFNTAGYVTFLNDSFCRITGFSKEELLGKHITSMQTLRKRDILKYIKGLSTIFQGKPLEYMTFTYKKKNGGTGIGYGYMTLADLFGNKELILIATDITKFKKHAINYELISNISEFGLIETDTDGKINNINNKMLNYLIKDEKSIKNIDIFNLPIFDETDKNNLKKLFSLIKKDKNAKTFTLNNTQTVIEILPIEFDDEFYGVNLLFDFDNMRHTADKLHHDNINQTNESTYEHESPLNNIKVIDEINNSLFTIQESLRIMKIQKKYNEQLLNVIEDQTLNSILHLDQYGNKNYIDSIITEEKIINHQ